MARLRVPLDPQLPFEFVVVGRPYSSQNKTAGYTRWREQIQRALIEEVDSLSKRRGFLLSREKTRAQVVWLSAQPDAIDHPDPANIAKPLLDALTGVVIEDDRQVRRVEVVPIDLNSVGLRLPPVLEEAQDDPLFGKGEVVYVRLDRIDAADGPAWDWWK